jgi:hypothetical protein
MTRYTFLNYYRYRLAVWYLRQNWHTRAVVSGILFWILVFVCIALLYLFGDVLSAHATELPDTPAPKVEPLAPKPPDRFLNRPEIVSLTILGLVQALDYSQTVHFLREGRREQWMPTQSPAKLAAIGLGADTALILTEYWAYKHHHHRFLRVLQIAAPIPNAAGVVSSVHYGSFR